MCENGKRSGSLILSTVEATGNCDLFKLPHVNEYPEYDVQYLSKYVTNLHINYLRYQNKLLTCKIEFVFSTPRDAFRNLYVLPKSHALLPVSMQVIIEMLGRV